MPIPGLDYDRFVNDGVRGIMILILILIGLAIVWGVQTGKIQLVVFRYGDMGYIEIFGRPVLCVGIGTWLYVEGIFTQSKTSTRERTRTHLRRDEINGVVTVTQVTYTVRVNPDKLSVWSAIYRFIDEDSNLSDGRNQSFVEFIDTKLAKATSTLIMTGGVQSLNRDAINTGCGIKLAGAGVSLLYVDVRESAPPNEYATGMGLLKHLNPAETPEESTDGASPEPQWPHAGTNGHGNVTKVLDELGTVVAFNGNGKHHQ